MKGKVTKRLLMWISMALIILPLISSIMPVYASSSNSGDVPFYTYSYWQDEYGSSIVQNKAMYKVKKLINSESLGISNFTQISDMCIGPDGYIYLIDSDAAEVTVIDSEHNFVTSIKSFIYGDEVLTLTKPRGVFVSDKNELYVCDTEAARILVCDLDGKVNRILTVPESSLVPENFLYRPLRIAIDNKGYTYVLSDGSYYGAVFYNPEGDFIGFYGANSVEKSILTVLKTLWDKLTMTNEKRSGSIKSLPYQFTDLYIDSGGFVYTATGATNSGSKSDTIRRLSPGGVNILNSENIEFGESSITTKSDGEVIAQDISGLCVDDYGFIYAYDRSLGNIYVYDAECNFINAFGGGVGSGTQNGVFQLPCAIDIYENDLYVCDSNNQSITVFEITEYGSLIKQSQKYTLDGDYELAKDGWTKVLALDKNCRQAYIGLGKAALSEKDYKSALSYSKDGLDRNTYAQAFEQVRGIWLSENFSWLFVIAIITVSGIIFGLAYKRKRKIVWIKNRSVQLATTAVFHPAESFTEIKEKKNGSVLAACIIILLFYISEIIKNDFYGFLFSSSDSSAFNSIIVLARSVGAVVIWSISNVAVSTLFGGRGKFREIFIITSYSLNVLIIANIVCTVLSNFLLPAESAFLSLFMLIAQLYTIMIITFGLIIIHDFSFGKFVGTTILSIFGVLLIVFLIAATIILVQQFGAFFATIFYEITFR